MFRSLLKKNIPGSTPLR